jgi:hypothetical protein
MRRKTPTIADIDLLQQQAAERWHAKQRARELGLPSKSHPTPSLSEDHDPSNSVDHHRHTYNGPEDDLEL